MTSEAQLMKRMLEAKAPAEPTPDRNPRTLLAHYRASSREDLEHLAGMMDRLTDARKAAGVAAIHANGLMLPRGVLKLAVMFPRLAGGKAGITKFFQQLYLRDAASMNAMWDQTREHMLRGKDTEDKNSVGGWSQRELDIFTQEIMPQLVR